MRRTATLVIALACLTRIHIAAQSAAPITLPSNASIASQPVLDAAGEEQRHAIGAIYLVVCPIDQISGSGFLLSNGLMVTNNHVIGTCDKNTLFALSSDNNRVLFAQIEKDVDRDLALLRPSELRSGGLRLSAELRGPVPGTTVTTWGYPLLYNGVSPLLSVGYIAGYRDEKAGNRTVKRIIVNGAFNPGNSGGPLLAAHSNEVVGVVVATYHMFPPQIDAAIQAFIKGGHGGMSTGTFSTTDANGKTTGLYDLQVVGIILEQFYQRTQVMLGEAISVSELRDFVREKSGAFRVAESQARGHDKR